MGQTITIVTAVVGTLTAIALATISMFQVRETRRQVAVSQQQFRESIQARYDDMLPVVIPGEGFNGITPMYSYMNAEGHETTTSGYSDSIRLQNIGNGVAFNVSFTAFAIRHPPSGEVKYTKGAIIHIPEPVAPGSGTPLYSLSEITAIPHSATLHDPSTQTSITLGPPTDLPTASLRTTITYADLYSRKHACVYEYVHPRVEGKKANWKFVCSLHNIPQDIRDLDHYQ